MYNGNLRIFLPSVEILHYIHEPVSPLLDIALSQITAQTIL